MIRFAHVLFFVLSGLTLSAFSQDAAEWRRFATDSEDFSFEYPGTLKSEKDGPVRRSVYSGEGDGARILVVSEPLNATSVYDQCLRVIGNFPSAGFDLGALPATRFSKSDDDFDYAAVTVRTASRVYLFFIVAPLGNSEKIDRFLKSVAIDPKAESGKPDAVQKVDPDLEKSKTPVWPGKSAQTSDDRRFPESRSIPAEPMNRPETDNAGLRILSNPRPSYTETARLFRIEGDIALRITFSANGTIGAVSTLSKLPFGLTESAIGAARNIKFVAARRNKKAYDVTKSVVYTFSL